MNKFKTDVKGIWFLSVLALLLAACFGAFFIINADADSVSVDDNASGIVAEAENAPESPVTNPVVNETGFTGLKGTVVDSKTSEPLEGVIPYLKSDGTIYEGAASNVDGEFTIENIPCEGSIYQARLYLYKENYTTYESYDITLIEDEITELGTINLIVAYFDVVGESGSMNPNFGKVVAYTKEITFNDKHHIVAENWKLLGSGEIQADGSFVIKGLDRNYCIDGRGIYLRIAADNVCPIDSSLVNMRNIENDIYRVQDGWSWAVPYDQIIEDPTGNTQFTMQKILPPGPSNPEGKTITYISSSKYGFTNDFLADYDVCYYVENHALFFGLKQDGELKESYKIRALGPAADTYRWFMDGVELVEGVVYNFDINVKHSFAGVAADQPQPEEEYVIAQTGDNVIPVAVCVLAIIGSSVVLLRRRFN